MKYILKFKWPVTVLMILFAAVTFLISPNLTQLATEKGDVQLSDEQPSEQARVFLEEYGEDNEMMSLVLEFGDKVSENESDINDYIEEIDSIDGVDNVVNPFDFAEEMQTNFINDENGVIMIPMEYTGPVNEIGNVAAEVEDLNSTDAKTSMTSNELIQNTVEQDAMEGIQSTEIFTVIIVIAVLLIMFRSVVTPLVPVAVVGLSYLIGQSFVGWFVEWFGFPVSPQTQSFLIVILFGIGTDYCILLLNRFKEELQLHGKYESVLRTFRTGGKTVFISGLSGAIVFGVLYFANFEIYRSAVGVAIGIAFLLLSLFTVLPILMQLLGRYIFWPNIKKSEFKESKLWTPLGIFSLKYPTRIIFTVIAILIAVAFFYNDEVNYDSLEELDDSYSAVHATNVVSENFDEGQLFPVEVIISNGGDLLTPESLSRLEAVASTLDNIDGVKEVQTLTRPSGEAIDDFLVRNQLEQANSGMDDMTEGLAEISDGLSEASEGIAGSEMAGGDLSELNQGIDDINASIAQISTYMAQTGDAQGASRQLGQVQQGLGTMSEQVAAANEQMTQQQEAASAQMEELSTGLEDATSGIDEIQGGLEEVQTLLGNINDNEAVDQTGLHVPEEFLETDGIKDTVDQYSFGDDKALRMNVVLDVDPYSPESMNVLDDIESTVNNELQRLGREDTVAYFSGVTSMNRDLDEISTDDYTRVITIFIATLFVILAVVFRSLILPVTMIGSIFVTYFASLTITQWLLGLLGLGNLNWAVPFFSLIIFAALGIDYSIFIIDRFREELANKSIRDAIEHSIRRMGVTVITAVIILSGTFAALLPSGMIILIQVASIIIFALLFYAFIVLPLLVPAFVITFRRGNWWPFRMPGGKDREDRFKEED
ncbi:MAG TPA: MMPL family transporter [Candidatus Salinicoccus stercoripullorum]|uniref:MMPL family transporter n=1 Tax=Candidatus Salinicoccus stercoripullorum TaxID=2838756 RepID=A0A9D1QJS9_9STAP|nr:MMPL family transporter [Candidatus Salinicoccus stercoripullorum]